MGAVIFGINGGFIPNTHSSVHNSSISRLSIIRFASNFSPVKKSWNLDGRKPRFSGVCAFGNREARAPVLWIYLKPNKGIGSNCVWEKKSRDFDGRRNKFCATSGVANGEVEGHSVNVKVIEKEFTFNPMFDDYVKVMESVRTDRSKNLSEDVGGGSPKKRLMKRVTSCKVAKKVSGGGGKLGYRDREMDDKHGQHGDVERSSGGWDLVERILEKRTAGRSGNGSKDGRNGKEINRYRRYVDDVHFEKERVDDSMNYSKNSMVGQKKGREVGRIDELRVQHGSKGALEIGSSDLFGEVKEVGRSPKEFYDKNVDGVDNGIGGTVRENIHQSMDEDIYKNKVDRKMGEFANSKISPERRFSLEKRTMRLPDESLVHKVNGKMDKFDYNKISLERRSSIESRSMKQSDESSVNKISLERRISIESRSMKQSDESSVKRSYGSGWFYENDTSKKTVESDISKIVREDEISKTDKRKDGSNFSRIEAHNFVKDTNGLSRSHSHVRVHVGSRETKKLVSTTTQVQRCGNGKIWSGKIPGENIHGMDIEDRVAFRTFEEFTDIRNRPRVLRMELEERIQKLAKRLNATDVNMPEWQFSKMIHGAKIKFTEHSILRVVQILGALGNWKRALQVVEWLQVRERFKAYKTRYIYTTVLDVLGKAKRPVEALNLFYAMRQGLSSYPDIAAYHCIAVTLGQAGLMKELFDVIDCMRAAPEKKFNLGPLQKWDPRLEPDLVIYNAVLNACVQQKQWEGAFWVLQQLKQHNIQPTNTTYGLIMETMLACERYNLVHEVFKKVEKTSIPSVLNYKVLVITLWREGKTDEAVLAVKDMERRGVVGSASLYYDLARCLCCAGKCKEALLQINKICKVAKKPLVVTYTGLIQACVDSGSIENGAYIFNQMHKYCSPNTVTCNIMLRSYIEHGMYGEAKDLFWKILDNSHKIKNKTDSDQKAIPDKFTFNTMLDACASTNNWDDFESTYSQMLHHGYHFDTRRHLRMVLDASRSGKKQAIETTWDHLIRFGRAPPLPIIQERFCIKLEEDNHLGAISLIEVHQESEMSSFSKKSWQNLLKSNSHRFRKDTISKLTLELSSLIARRSQPHLVYQNMLNACKEIC